MLPRAQTLVKRLDCIHHSCGITYACSLTSRTLEERRAIKCGTAPAPITTWVCSEVPEAMSFKLSAPSRAYFYQCNLTGQSPSSFKLEHWVSAGQEFDESGHDAALNDFVNRWIFFLWKKSSIRISRSAKAKSLYTDSLSELHGSVQLSIGILAVNSLEHTRKDITKGCRIHGSLIVRFDAFVGNDRLKVSSLGKVFFSLQ